MRVEDLKTLFEYDRWASEHLFTVIQSLTPEEFVQPVAGGFESVRNTMVHILSTVWGWVERCGGPARGERLNPEDFPTPESLQVRWGQVDDLVASFLSTLTDEDLLLNAEYEGYGGAIRTMPVGELLHHTANHGVHHRGQVAVLLRELGHAPGYFDLLFYFAAKRGVPGW